MVPIMQCLPNRLMLMCCQMRTFTSEAGIHKQDLSGNQCVRGPYRDPLVSILLYSNSTFLKVNTIQWVEYHFYLC